MVPFRIGCCLLLSMLAGWASAQEPAYSWVEMGPDGAIARAVMEGNACPSIEVDGKAYPMEVRTDTTVVGFEGLKVCSYTIPKGTDRVRLGKKLLPIPTSEINRILVLGDTGCRIKSDDVQNCNGKGEGPAWAFAKVAQSAASMKPDLVVHVGDYLYREAPCPKGNAGCAGSPYGDNWATWQVDFFEPAQTLLWQAPWVFVRGNHEDCSRSWRGFFLFLDPMPATDETFANCPENPDPYLVDVGKRGIAVIDTANIPHAYEPPPDPATVEVLSKQLNTVNKMAAKGEVWTATHRPYWGVSTYTDKGEVKLSPVDYTLQAALAKTTLGKLAPNIALALAGHIHQFELLTFDDGRPNQLVVGTGGTKLDPPLTKALMAANPSVFETLKTLPKNVAHFDQFAYMIITVNQNPFSMTLYNDEGSVIQNYTIFDKMDDQ